MWQVYAFMAHDLLEDRRREAESARRIGRRRTGSQRVNPSGLFRRILTGRQDG